MKRALVFAPADSASPAIGWALITALLAAAALLAALYA